MSKLTRQYVTADLKDTHSIKLYITTLKYQKYPKKKTNNDNEFHGYTG